MDHFARQMFLFPRWELVSADNANRETISIERFTGIIYIEPKKTRDYPLNLFRSTIGPI